jgi:HK97 family phage major capsid protein
MDEFLQRLVDARAGVYAERAAELDARKAVLEMAKSAGRTHLSQSERRTYDRHSATIRRHERDLTGLDARIREQRDEIRRSGRLDNPLLARLGAGGGTDANSHAKRWAAETASHMRRAFGGERRAIISGSVDVPSLVEASVTAIPHPLRLVDLVGDRQSVDSMAYEYYRQTARTNAATAVADLAQKPTSTLTVEAVEDRCRVVAHLSQPMPYRIWLDNQAITSWMYSEMAAGVLDGIEAQFVSGNGTGENMTGVLNLSGTTAVAYATDVPTTLRSAITAMQEIGERPNAWVLSPQDAQALDLTRWGTSGGLLTGGYENDNALLGFGSSSNIFGDVSQRIVSKSVPQGTALLADWSQARLYIREGTRVDLDASGPLFQTNAIMFRGEARLGVAFLRPQAFAVVDLTSGS